MFVKAALVIAVLVITNNAVAQEAGDTIPTPVPRGDFANDLLKASGKDAAKTVAQSAASQLLIGKLNISVYLVQREAEIAGGIYTRDSASFSINEDRILDGNLGVVVQTKQARIQSLTLSGNSSFVANQTIMNGLNSGFMRNETNLLLGPVIMENDSHGSLNNTVFGSGSN